MLILFSLTVTSSEEIAVHWELWGCTWALLSDSLCLSSLPSDGVLPLLSVYL